MAGTLRHRGPDDEGFYVERVRRRDLRRPRIRRLSIIDLETGHQPIANEDGSVQVVFNGEIYNFRELRAELEAAATASATHADTEVIVHLYEDSARAASSG